MAISYLDKIMPSGTPRWLMGQTLHLPGKEKFAGYKGKGLSWGMVDQEQRDAIDILELWPDDVNTTQVPPVVATLPHLKTLIIPSWFVATLQPSDLPASLETLHIGVKGEKKTMVSWNRAHAWPNIRTLDVAGVSSDFYAGCFPGLSKTLAISTDHKRLSLAEIGQCENLTNLFLYKARSVEDINHAGAPHLAFAGWMDAKNADFRGLSGHHRLKEAEIKWNKSLVSLQGLEQLPELEQLEVSGCPKLADLADVTAIKTLQWLRIIDCGAAWAASEQDLRKKLAGAGFEKIRVEPYGRHTLLEAWRKL